MSDSTHTTPVGAALPVNPVDATPTAPTGPTRFRKKPVEIDAMQWDGGYESQSAIVTWSRGEVAGYFDGAYFLRIETLEGDMRANPGDWIIRGLQGEFYPCKPDIFEATYEAAEVAS